MKLMIAALVLSLPLLAAAQSPTVWRCGADGRSYSDVPCDQGRQLALASSRPAADVQAARELAAQERRAADTLLNERLRREAAVRSMGVAPDRPGARVKPAAKPPAAAKAKAKQRSAQPEGAGIFRAVAPASPRKKG
jgi:hypothetical protein